MLLPLLFYYQLLNNPYGVILRKGYSFSESVSALVSVPEVFPSSFFTFIMFIYFVWRWDLNGIVFIGGFSGIGNGRGVELRYLGYRVGR